MIMSEKIADDPDVIIKNGRIFKPVYKHLLDNMPKDLVQEMARRRLEELDAAREKMATDSSS